MELQLSKTKFLVGDNISIADIALYAYTHVADEGGFNLEPYPNIERWIGVIRKLALLRNST
nr:glutathione binding-like protein [Vibrio diabolicus]